ncbi:MAG: putative aminohydrolase SsnA [Spirochaetes bacterium]|nr:putative aminohydrolase SsnA [Spirochaetota bacterium]MBU1080104.1 putative aminohydrolase SsnA [Spirochaetota bacterium]
MKLLEGVRVLHFHPGSVSEPTDVAIDGAKIVEVGPGLAAKYPAATRHSPGGYVSPGLVCSHNHFYSVLARGLMVGIEPSKDFAQQLRNMWWLLDRALDEGIVRASGLAGAADAAMLGVTSVVDHHASPEFIDGSLDVLAEGFAEVGLRGLLCYEATDRNGEADGLAGVRENERFARKVDAERAAGGSPLVDGAIGAHAPFTVGEKTLGALASACKSTGRGLHIHVAEDKFDAVDSRYRFGEDICVRLDGAGLLGPKTILGHGLYLTRSEIELVNERDSFIAHNARSNMNNCVGYNDNIGLYRNAVLGTDGIGSDMLEEAGFAFFKHKDSGGSRWMDSYLEMLQNGNRLLERYFPGKRLGRVEAGYEADLTFWDYDPPVPLEGANVAGHVAFGMGSRMVASTMVAGEFIVKDRKPLFDAEAIAARGRSETRRLWKRMEERK